MNEVSSYFGPTSDNVFHFVHLVHGGFIDLNGFTVSSHIIQNVKEVNVVCKYPDGSIDEALGILNCISNIYFNGIPQRAITPPPEPYF